MDCHRTWEMLYFGMIPIVKTSTLDLLFTGLPVVILQTWEDLCVLDLELEYGRLAHLLPVPSEVFTLGHWIQKEHL
jgi:hypothetical protein